MDMGDDTGVQVWFGPCYEVRLSSQLRYPGPEVFEFEGCDPWYGDASKVTLVPAEPKFEDNDFDVEGEMLQISGIESLLPGMRSCEQTRGMTILDHGIGVHRSWKEVLSGAPPEGLELWWPKLLSEVGGYSALDIEEYHIYHDCGKPLCLMIDAEGRRHFPDHARVSYEAYLGAGGKPEIAEWILHDMDIHTCSAADLEGFGQIRGSVILLLTGLAEIRANAEMFGGVESTGYKIKYKHWFRRAKAYLTQRYGVM